LQTPSETTRRFRELDGLRGVLAWIVVASHILVCVGWIGPIVGGDYVLSQVAAAAVDVFIILSGFAITRLLIVTRESGGRYIWRRICRIFPAYWAALLAGIALNAWVADNLRQLPQSAVIELYLSVCEVGGARLWTDGIIHFFLLQGLVLTSWLPAEPVTLLGVAWSLSLEWQFYLVAPFALRLALTSKIGFALISLVAILGALYSGKLAGVFSGAFLPVRASYFLFGGISFVAATAPVAKRWFILLSAATILTISWGIGCGHYLETIAAPIGWLIVMAATFSSLPTIVRSFLNSVQVQFLGRVSYSTYLFHGPVIAVVQHAVWHWVNPGNQIKLLVLTIIGSVPLITLVSYLSWRFIEYPGQKLGHLRQNA
jgi:peptidoglycan/LPS O-acetylase OafA/YrhL